MQLTTFTDYSFRVLIFLGIHRAELVSIAQISEAYGISKNHLMKVVHHLGQVGLIDTVRGRGGGIRLAHAPEQIGLGDVVRKTEPHLDIVECFDPERTECAIVPACALTRVLAHARDAFLAVLDDYTLADLIRPKRQLRQLIPLG